jgi:hypothetical protein
VGHAHRNHFGSHVNTGRSACNSCQMLLTALYMQKAAGLSATQHVINNPSTVGACCSA